MAEKDLYGTLGVARGASAADIRKAYRRLARKHHPDVNPGNKQAEDRFKDISYAYDVLSDPEKRKVYDEFGIQGLQSGFDPSRARQHREWRSAGAGTSGFGKYESFEDVFSDLGDLFGSRGRSARRGPTRGRDLEVAMEIDLLDSIRGGTQTISLRRAVSCSECGGAGGQGSRTCTECQGEGTVRVGGGPLSFGRTCPRCAGSGRTIATPCARCGGSGRTDESETLNVKIPAGIDEGAKIRLAGKGEAGTQGGLPGDLLITMRLRPHPFLERKGLDLSFDLPVTVGEAALGASIQVPTPNGDVSLRLPPGTQSGKQLRLRGKGVRDARGSAVGDLTVRVLVQIPRDGGDRMRKAVAELDECYDESPRKNLRL